MIKVEKNTFPSNGYVAGRKVWGYVPAGNYEVFSTVRNHTCLVPIGQDRSSNEGCYYWVRSGLIVN